jgi:hypothetical protein
MPADAAKAAWLGSRVAIFQYLGLFLATSTLRQLEEDVLHLAISAYSMSEPRIDDEQSISSVGAYRRGRSSAKAN